MEVLSTVARGASGESGSKRMIIKASDDSKKKEDFYGFKASVTTHTLVQHTYLEMWEELSIALSSSTHQKWILFQSSDACGLQKGGNINIYVMNSAKVL